MAQQRTQNTHTAENQDREIPGVSFYNIWPVVFTCCFITINCSCNCKQKLYAYQNGFKTARQFGRLQATGSYIIGGRSGLSLRGVYKQLSGTTIRVASSLLDGHTFQLNLTPSLSSFCCMNSWYVDISCSPAKHTHILNFTVFTKCRSKLHVDYLSVSLCPTMCYYTLRSGFSQVHKTKYSVTSSSFLIGLDWTFPGLSRTFLQCFFQDLFRCFWGSWEALLMKDQRYEGTKSHKCPRCY